MSRSPKATPPRTARPVSFKTGYNRRADYGHVIHQSRVSQGVGAISETLIHLGTTVIIGYGGYLALRGPHAMTAGELAAFLGYVGILYGPVCDGLPRSTGRTRTA